MYVIKKLFVSRVRDYEYNNTIHTRMVDGARNIQPGDIAATSTTVTFILSLCLWCGTDSIVECDAYRDVMSSSSVLTVDSSPLSRTRFEFCKFTQKGGIFEVKVGKRCLK